MYKTCISWKYSKGRAESVERKTVNISGLRTFIRIETEEKNELVSLMKGPPANVNSGSLYVDGALSAEGFHHMFYLHITLTNEYILLDKLNFSSDCLYCFNPMRKNIFKHINNYDVLVKLLTIGKIHFVNDVSF